MKVVTACSAFAKFLKEAGLYFQTRCKHIHVRSASESRRRRSANTSPPLSLVGQLKRTYLYFQTRCKHIHVRSASESRRRRSENTNLTRSLVGHLPSFFVVALLSACSSDSGQKTGAENPAPTGSTGGGLEVVYDGPVPNSEDVNNFKNELWNNIAAENRCGGCHVQGGESPSFARSDDINDAFTAANGIVSLSDPASSRMVEKVATGHNCWSTDVKFCEEKITDWISKWASNSGVEFTQVALREPEKSEVSASLVFPSDTANFATLVHAPILQKYCSDCHRADAPQPPVQPFFASGDVSSAYAAAQSKMLFNVTTTADGTSVASINASRSRLVIRLREESHNCWSQTPGGDADCASAGAQLEKALEDFAATMGFVGLDDTLVTSKAMRIADGTAISQGGRTETNAIALYPFKAGQGSVVNDYSDGFPPALNLNLVGDVEWVSNWGVRINSGHVIGPVSSSEKLHRYISQTGEYSIETWAIPANVTQDGPARIVSYSGSNASRNFTLGQTLYNYDLLNRSTTTNQNGDPMVSTPDNDEVLQATLQHVVVNYNTLEGRKIYVNGELIVDNDPQGGGLLTEWDNTFALILGNETSGDYPWRGTIRFLAIHNRVLTAEQVKGNYEVGVGQKILVAFAIDHLVADMNDAYIVFQVEQFDDYSYLFNNPYFFSFTETLASDIEIKGLRIGLNGKEAGVGQAYAKLDVTLRPEDYSEENGIPLSDLGTIISLEKGPDQDQFFLGFDSINGVETSRPPVDVPTPPEPADLPEAQPRLGIKTFDEINASLSAMTGIPVTQPGVVQTFKGDDGISGVHRQLPSEENINGFLVSHQMGITQLAVKYCNVLATDDSRMASFFPGFSASGSSFDESNRSALIEPLLNALVANSVDGGAQPSNQPDLGDSRQRLNDLIDTMTSSCGATCSNTVTDNTVTAVCAAAFGSAVMLIQ